MNIYAIAMKEDNNDQGAYLLAVLISAVVMFFGIGMIYLFNLNLFFMKITIKKENGHWTVNGKKYAEMNLTEQRFFNEFISCVKLEGNSKAF